MDDLDMLLPAGIVDAEGLFLEEEMNNPDFLSLSNADAKSVASETSFGGSDFRDGSTTNGSVTPSVVPAEIAQPSVRRPASAKPKAKSRSRASTKKRSSSADPSEEEDKKLKRRRQIATASRASRARRKRELEDLRDENKRLREERSQFLSKIGELQMKVENLRERGSTDMRVENELLRVQLEEHKRFVSCFKRLCDGAPTSLNARHAIYRSGSDSAQAHVLGLISQSQAEGWLEAKIPDEADIPYQNFSMFYSYKADYGEKFSGTVNRDGTVSSKKDNNVRKRLNVRIDILFPGMDASQIAEFFWSSFSNTEVQQKLYKIKGIELTALADDMPDKDTKMVYYREKWDPPKRDQDFVLICNRRKRDLAKSTMGLPPREGVKATDEVYGKSMVKTELGKVSAEVLAMTTTQHSVAPAFDNANRITSMFVQGGVAWNVGGDSRLCVVFSFPDDFNVKAVGSFAEILSEDGTMTLKFADILLSFNKMLGEADMSQAGVASGL